MFWFKIHIVCRNLLKNKLQFLVAILIWALGLTGLICAAFGWHYLVSYRTQTSDAAQLFVIEKPDAALTWDEVGFLLMKHASEHIETVCRVIPCHLWYDGQYEEVMLVDTASLEMLGVKILQGDCRFLDPEGCHVAVTEHFAMEHFGTLDVLGQTLPQDSILGRAEMERTIAALVATPSIHSDLYYEVLMNGRPTVSGHELMLVKLKKRVCAEQIQKLLNTLSYPTGLPIRMHQLQSIHVVRSDVLATIDMLRGVLILSIFLFICTFSFFCATERILFSWKQQNPLLTFFATKRNDAFKGFYIIRLTLLMLCLWLCSLVMLEIIWPHYSRLLASEHLIPFWSVFLFSIGIVLILFFIYLISSWLAARSLCCSRNEYRLHAVTAGFLVLQLAVVMIFSVLTLQVTVRLHDVVMQDPGFDMQHVAGIQLKNAAEKDKILSLLMARSDVVEVFTGEQLFPVKGMVGEPVALDGLSGGDTDSTHTVFYIRDGAKVASFYHLTIVAGECLSPMHPDTDLLITESVAWMLGWSPEEAVGQSVTLLQNNPCRIIGVCKDIYNHGMDNRAAMYVLGNRKRLSFNNVILFRYVPGTETACMEALEAGLHRRLTDDIYQSLSAAFLQRYMSGVRTRRVVMMCYLFSLLVSLFGLYAFLNQLCQAYSRNMALHKVYGAGALSVIRVLTKPLWLILGISALLSIPVSFLLVQWWYHVGLDDVMGTWWCCPAGFCMTVLGVALAMGPRMQKAVHEDPAEALNS